MTTAVEAKKFAIDYQIEDDNGKPIGPPQHFEADTQKELLDLVKNAHKNAAKKMYETIKKVKIGDLITPDPEKPIKRYERRALSADERTRLANAVKDPQTAPEATKTLMEAELGVPFEDLRQGMEYLEIRRRIDQAQLETDAFLQAHPEYINTDGNKEWLLKWLEKRNFALTRKNLELAFEDLSGATGEHPNVLTLRAPEPVAPPQPEPVTPAAEPTQPVPTAATPVEAALPAPPQPEAIPPAATPAPAITDQPAEVRPAKSSSGLGRDSGGAPPPDAPKAKEIPYAQLAKMNSTQYQLWLNDPANRELVKLMDRK